MNFTELIYKTLQFFFDDLTHFIMLLILIGTFQGLFSTIYGSISEFFVNVKKAYKKKVEKISKGSNIDFSKVNSRDFMNTRVDEDQDPFTRK